MRRPRFCPDCEVNLDLHPMNDDGTYDLFDCEDALRRANNLRRMEAAFAAPFLRWGQP